MVRVIVFALAIYFLSYGPNTQYTPERKWRKSRRVWWVDTPVFSWMLLTIPNEHVFVLCKLRDMCVPFFHKRVCAILRVYSSYEFLHLLFYFRDRKCVKASVDTLWSVRVENTYFIYTSDCCFIFFKLDTFLLWPLIVWILYTNIYDFLWLECIHFIYTIIYLLIIVGMFINATVFIDPNNQHWGLLVQHWRTGESIG